MPARRRESFTQARERRAAVDDPAVVLDAAARFLESRPRSVVEVRRRLIGAGYRQDLVEGSIARLLDLGILGDEAFARVWVESRDRARPRGERAIRAELRLKGIDTALTDAVLEERRNAAPEATADGDPVSIDHSAAARLLARHQGSLERVVDPRKRGQRAYALLARHGFDSETAADAVRRWAGQGTTG
jgi:SOS response regulatory protein OraA/RecX